jgi:hypothetical protein
MFAALVIENPELADFLSGSRTIVLWLQLRLFWWLFWIAILTVLLAVVSLVYSTLVHRNPVRGLVACVRGSFEAIRDLVLLPAGFRRIWAIAKLSFKEAIRRKILYVFVMFLLPLLFAGWYLRAATDEEGRLVYLVAFVTNVITWLLLPLVVFVTSMSLPNDLKLQTLHTVVTKPVRRLEIVVGRILGFMGIFTLVLAVMAVVCLIYVAGEMSQVDARIRNEQWTARVPIYASPEAAPPIQDQEGRTFRYPLLFEQRDQSGNVRIGPGGRNVGKEWQYRSHIEGATSEAALWYFRFDPSQFDAKAPVRVEMTFDVFKTTKGDPTREDAKESGVWCSLQFFDGTNSQRIYDRAFHVRHHRTTAIDVPADVFKTGLLVIRAQCLTPTQFLGMAPHDLFFLAQQRSFSANFLKGAVGLWLKVLFLVAVAVAASTVLNGYVTILFTSMVYLIGYYHEFLIQLIRGEVKGGGPVESFYRLITQDAQTSPLPSGLLSDIMVRVDSVLLLVLNALSKIVPDLNSLDTAQFVAQGFDIPSIWLARNLLLVLGYVAPTVVVGYLLLKNREIAL